MKLALALVVVISTWGMLMLAATSMEITKPKSPPPPPPAAFPKPQTAPELVLLGGSDDAASYSTFIGGLLNKVKDPTRSYFKVPMIQLFDRLQFMYVKLQSAAENTITLAVKMDDLYVVGYSYKYKDQVRARFLKLDSSIQQTVQANLFPEAKNTDKNIGYEGSYVKLQNAANTEREKIPLGRQTLETYINEIIYKDPTKQAAEFRKTEARLLLVVIQMVSEAIRFKYIENKIKDNFSNGYYPDPRALDLENNWDKLTEAIVAADRKTGKIPNNLLDNLKIKYANGTQQNIQSVYDITPDMGLLKYIAASSSLLATM